jgi:hypothetical protein
VVTGEENGRPVEGGRDSEPVAPTESALPKERVYDGEVLTDVENEYVTRWLAFSQSGSRSRKEIQRRWSAQIIRRRVELARRSVARVVVAAWRAEHVVRVRSVLGYRVRKAPVDGLRLAWFVIRGHSRWIGKAWTFFTYADLRADARAARRKS